MLTFFYFEKIKKSLQLYHHLRLDLTLVKAKLMLFVITFPDIVPPRDQLNQRNAMRYHLQIVGFG